MAVTSTTRNTLLAALAPQSTGARLAFTLAAMVLGSVLLAVSARISIPVQPVAFTLQSMTVALIAAAFGWRIGVGAVALYIAEGLSGLPVFSTGGGIDYIFRPSFGFIVGWLPMAFIIGRAADAGMTRRLLLMFSVMVLADAVSFVFGFAWLMVVSNMILSSGAALPGWLEASNLVTSAYRGAVEPFVIWDIVKMAFAAVTVGGAALLLKPRG